MFLESGGEKNSALRVERVLIASRKRAHPNLLAATEKFTTWLPLTYHCAHIIPIAVPNCNTIAPIFGNKFSPIPSKIRYFSHSSNICSKNALHLPIFQKLPLFEICRHLVSTRDSPAGFACTAISPPLYGKKQKWLLRSEVLQ